MALDVHPIRQDGFGEVEVPVVAAHQGAAARWVLEVAGTEEGEAEADTEGVRGGVVVRGEGVQAVGVVGLAGGRAHDGDESGAGRGGDAAALSGHGLAVPDLADPEVAELAGVRIGAEAGEAQHSDFASDRFRATCWSCQPSSIEAKTCSSGLSSATPETI